MPSKSTLTNFIIISLLVLFGVMARFLPHPPNFVPLTAIALFASVKLKTKYSYLLPLGIIIISDLFIGLHDVIPFTWGSYLAIGIIGKLLAEKGKPAVIFGTTILASLLFFIITNLGVWLVGSWYPHTLAGLINCYTLAVPFFRNTLMGDLFYTGVFFGSYELLISTVIPGLTRNLYNQNTRSPL